MISFGSFHPAARRADLPAAYGPRTTSYNHLVRCLRAGVWDQIRTGGPSSAPTSAPCLPRKSKTGCARSYPLRRFSTDGNGADAALAEAAAIVDEFEAARRLARGQGLLGGD